MKAGWLQERSGIIAGQQQSQLLTNRSEVHIWFAPVSDQSQELQSCYDVLSPDERSRYNRFPFEEDARRYLCAHGVLRKLLAKYLNEPAESIRITHSRSGKPRLAGVLGEKRLFFNLSYSNQLVGFALSTAGEIGIDLEYRSVLPGMAQLACSFFSHEEFDEWCSIVEEQRVQAFFNCWTRKEAFVKAVGNTSSYPLRQFGVSLAPFDETVIRHINGDRLSATKWSLLSTKPHAGYVASVAIRNTGLRWKQFDWNNPSPGYVYTREMAQDLVER